MSSSGVYECDFCGMSKPFTHEFYPVAAMIQIGDVEFMAEPSRLRVYLYPVCHVCLQGAIAARDLTTRTFPGTSV